MENIERRSCGETLELREIGGKPKIVGYAMVFGVLSSAATRVRERFMPGSFTQTLAEKPEQRSARYPDIMANLEHVGGILGRRKYGTLEVRQDNKGLWVEIDPPETNFGRDVVEQIRRRDLDGMSVEFYPYPGGERWVKDGNTTIREITNAYLAGVALTADPAYPDTTLALRSLEAWEKEEAAKQGYSTEQTSRRLRLFDALGKC